MKNDIFNYQPMLRSVAMKIVGSIEDAEDDQQSESEEDQPLWLEADDELYSDRSCLLNP